MQSSPYFFFIFFFFGFVSFFFLLVAICHALQGCVQAMKAAGAQVSVSEIDPICALQAAMEGLPVVRLADIISKVDIIVTATGNKDIVMVEDMAKMKNNAIVGNIGHFDNEIDMKSLYTRKGMSKKKLL